MGVSKGKISALYNGGKAATVTPYLGEIVTPKLTVPFFLEGCLSVGMVVIYVTFEDNTGAVLARMDGAWNEKPVHHTHTDSQGGSTSGPQ